MIRDYEPKDLEIVRAIHKANDLPENCFPNLMIRIGEEDVPNPLFIVKAIMEMNGKPVMASFLKGTAEIYLFVDHTQGTAEERWQWLKEFTEYIYHEAWKHGLEQITCWVPRKIEKSFRKRLKDLGFDRSPWSSYTLPIESCGSMPSKSG
jgi:hypothetical protein